MQNTSHASIQSLIKTQADFPKPGVLFLDIAPVFEDRSAFSLLNALLLASCQGRLIDKVVGIESRGFVLASALAISLNAGFVMVRKSKKLPRDVFSVAYALEYGEAVLEIHQDAIKPGERVVIVDDVLATGGTAAASIELVKRCNGVVDKMLFMIEIASLKGKERLRPHKVESLFSY